MTRPVQWEVLEPRLLLSAVLPGEHELFDLDYDGVNDAVLMNTGATEIQADVSGGGLAVSLTGDGAAFETNAWVAVDDVDPLDDFDLLDGRIGVVVDGFALAPIAGTSSVVAGSIGLLNVGVGDLGLVDATEGDIGAIVVEGDILGSVTAAGSIGAIAAQSIAGASVWAGGSVTEIAADAITGGTVIIVTGDLGELWATTVDDATIVVGGNLTEARFGTLSGSMFGTTLAVGGRLELLRADTITGGTDMSMLNVSAGGGAGAISADTITGGVDSMLSIAVTGGLETLNVGLLEGGESVGDFGWASADITVEGGINTICAGLINGGIGSGFSMLSINVFDQYAEDFSILRPGDVQKLTAAAITGGDMTGAGFASVFMSIWGDLAYMRVGQIIGSGASHPCGDPAVLINVGGDIGKLIAGEINAGSAVSDPDNTIFGYAAVNVTAGNDIGSIVAGTINGGEALGDFAYAAVNFWAMRDIHSIAANVISGGVADGDGATAGVYFQAGRNIDIISAGRISGTESDRPVWTPDPAVQFIAGGDIGLVMAGRISGGEIVADGEAVAVASVLVKANGTYVDPDTFEQSAGNIGMIVAGTITGGSATGENALAYVKIHAAGNIGALFADTISGGTTADGGTSYVNIVAEQDIEKVCVGTIIGSEGSDGTGDSTVQIQAYNDIKEFFANRIVAGEDGLVNILAGQYDADGNLVGGTIEDMVVHTISGAGGVVNVAAGGDIESLKVCRIISGCDGEVNIAAGGDITVDVRQIRSWKVRDPATGEIETGVSFSAGGEVNDRRGRIHDRYITEGATDNLPPPADLPEAPPTP